MTKHTKKQQEDSAAPAKGFEVDDDGIVTVDPLMVTSLEEVPDDHFGHYFATKSGRKLQGGGVKSEYAYYCVPFDAAPQRRQVEVTQLQAEGWRTVEGVRCQGIHGTIFRRPRKLQEQAIRRRNALNAIQDNRKAEFDQSDFANTVRQRDGKADGRATRTLQAMTVDDALNQE